MKTYIIFKMAASSYTVGVDIFCWILHCVPHIQNTQGKDGKYTTSLPILQR